MPTTSAMKVGLTAAGSSRRAREPSGTVMVQAYSSGSPSGSELALPSRATISPTWTVWLAPALAVGAWFSPGSSVTETVTVRLAWSSPSSTVTVTE